MTILMDEIFNFLLFAFCMFGFVIIFIASQITLAVVKILFLICFSVFQLFQHMKINLKQPLKDHKILVSFAPTFILPFLLFNFKEIAIVVIFYAVLFVIFCSKNGGGKKWLLSVPAPALILLAYLFIALITIGLNLDSFKYQNNHIFEVSNKSPGLFSNIIFLISIGFAFTFLSLLGYVKQLGEFLQNSIGLFFSLAGMTNFWGGWVSFANYDGKLLVWVFFTFMSITIYLIWSGKLELDVKKQTQERFGKRKYSSGKRKHTP